MVEISFLIVCGIFAILVMYLYFQNRYLKGILVKDISSMSIMNNLPVAFYYRDLQGNILFANNIFIELVKKSKKLLEKQNIMEIYNSRTLQSIMSEDSIVLKNKKILSVEKELIFNDVDISHYYRVIKAPIFNNCDITGIVVVLINIDTEKELEALKQSFVATLTHDLKTPTTAQLSTVNMLLDGVFGKLNPEQFNMLSLTKDSCQYMSDLIATIMDTYNFEYGKIELNSENFDIVSLISEICNSSKILTMKNNQTIKFLNQFDKFFVYADRLQIKRVIVNLLSNAITYSYSNSPIEIGLEYDDEFINVFIKNKSKQIPASELKTVFDKFKRTKFSRFNKAATGLGLYLAKQVIDLHEGKIYAESYEDGTCIFGFKLPKKDCALKI